MKNNPTHLLCSLFFLFLLSCKPSAKDLVLLGDEKKKSHDYAGALADYSAAITAKPTMYQAWHNRGECQLNLGFYDLAIKDFDESISLKPDFTLSQYSKGLCLLKLKKYPEALVYVEKARIADTAIKAELALANCYYYLGKNRQAIHYFSQALGQMPDSLGIYLGRGLAYYQMGNLTASKKDLDIYLAEGGPNPVVYRQLGLIYLRNAQSSTQIDSAIILIEQYKSKTKTIDGEGSKALTMAYLTRGKMLMTINKEIEAMADFSKVIEIDPANADAYYQRGKIMVSLGQPGEGCMDLQSALKNGNTDAKKLIGIYCGDIL